MKLLTEKTTPDPLVSSGPAGPEAVDETATLDALNKALEPDADIDFNLLNDSLRNRRPPRNGHRYLVLIYMRVYNELSPDNYTFETQWQRCVEKLDDFYGKGNWDHELLQDNGVSGRLGPRKTGVQKRVRKNTAILEEKIESGKYDGLVCYRINRLFRSSRWLAVWMEDLIIPSGIDLLSATESVDPTTALGRMMLKFCAIMDEYFSDGGGERVADDHATRAEQGYAVGPPPYGWRYQSREGLAPGQRRGIERNEDQIPHLLFMIEKVLKGWSTIRIARDLNRRQISTSRGGSNLWHDATVHGAVTNETHAGYVHSKRKGRIKGQHYEQRICDLSTIEQVRATLELRKRCGKSNVHKTLQDHLLNGVATCARCGNHLTVYTGSGTYRAYRCVKRRRRDGESCKEITIRAQNLENYVLEKLSDLSANPEMEALLYEEAERLTVSDKKDLIRQPEILEREQVSLQKQRKELLAALGRKAIDDEDFRLANDDLKEQEAQLLSRVEDARQAVQHHDKRKDMTAQVQKNLSDFRLCWEHLDMDERRHLMRLLIKELVVDRDERCAVVKIGVHLLPADERRIPFDSMRQMTVRPEGVKALTPRQLACLHHLGQGKTRKEVAIAMGITAALVHNNCTGIRGVLGVQDMQDAYLKAQKRIESLLPSLPLGPTRQCKVHSPKLDGVPVVSAGLMEVFPLFGQGASISKVSELTGLSPSAVRNRRARICDLFRVDYIFDAVQKAREMGILK